MIPFESGLGFAVPVAGVIGMLEKCSVSMFAMAVVSWSVVMVHLLFSLNASKKTFK
ncbi:hypothetical protein D3C76_1769580 [compost metagenome]